MIIALPRAWPPARRMTSWAMALLLVLLGTWSVALLNAGTPHRSWLPESRLAASAPEAASRPVMSAPPARRLPPVVVALVVMSTSVGVAGLLLAATQRGWADMALAGAGLLWALQIIFSARRLFGLGVAPPLPLLQTVMAVATVLTAWYGLKLIQRPTRRPRSLPLGRSVVVGLVAAAALAVAGGWNRPALAWILPLSCLALGVGGLMQGVELARRRHVRRSRHSIGAWLLVSVTALALGCGVHELSMRSVWPVASDAVVEAWLATCAAVLAVLATLLVLRFAQLARMLRQLGRSHRTWRTRLRESQRELVDTRDRLVLRERTDGQRQQRDRILREVHDELGHRLVAVQSELQRAGLPATTQQLMVTSLLELQMAYDALEPVPRPLADALAVLRAQLEPGLTDAGVRLAWTLDARASLLVLPTAQTLQLLRIVREALDPSQPHGCVVHGQDQARFALDVLDGETGRHLRLRIGADSLSVAGTASRALAPSWIKLQRQATMLGAQLVVEGSASAARSLELVMPLGGR